MTIAKVNKLTVPTEKIDVYVINNSDGTPRWIWPTNLSKPLFLKFYNQSTPKQLILVGLIKLIFFLRLQAFFFKRKQYSKICDFTAENWSLFTGTPGPNNKAVLYEEDDKGNGVFTKIAVGKKARKALKNEYVILRKLGAFQPQLSFEYGQCVEAKDAALKIKEVKRVGQTNCLSPLHIKALQELREASEQESTLNDWVQKTNIETRVKQICNAPMTKIPNFIVEGLIGLSYECMNGDAVNLCLAHGDFTPWNTVFTTNKKLGIFDWELAREGMPLGFDFFHFIFQTGILQKRQSWKGILETIYKTATPSIRKKVFGDIEVDIEQYLKLYLLFQINYYAQLYSEQEKWHEQVYWQLAVWSDALAWCLRSQNNRKVFIKQLFSNLKYTNYAALKLENISPENISKYSDIDLVILKKEYTRIVQAIQENPLIKDIKIVKKSFMSSIVLRFKDGTQLHLDLIWMIKRKELVFMNAKRMLTNAKVNQYDVKIASDRDTARYIHRFYTLNGQTIPEKYTDLVERELPNDSKRSTEELTRYFAKSKVNIGLLGLCNKLVYFWDTIRSFSIGDGFTITFSGVDGAGKSTIINAIKNEVEKKYRKPVIVLRHRPSMLPILSAYKYGKEEAEQRSIASLPRQGHNKSKVSSLIRFGYYFMDYVLGQWVIYFKYICRGFIVIYDRYYYDFINDAKRSNIELPTNIATKGLAFIRKPEFNFFLYASPEVILSRKKELSANDITTLTERYTNLFNELDKSCPKTRFINIENIDLQKTINRIVEMIG